MVIETWKWLTLGQRVEGNGLETIRKKLFGIMFCILIEAVIEWIYIFAKILLNYTLKIYAFYVNYNSKISKYKPGKIIVISISLYLYLMNIP